ncbi:MAG: hypothetical protein U9P90_04795, partial [Patescibacteria group bacterium]|nr:hypothetical protein [Patescibacteria group bacterium]
PHIGHIKSMESILKEKLVDEIWVFADRSHFRKKLAPLHHREKMLEIALKKINSPKIKQISNNSMSFDVSNPSSLFIYQQFKKHFPEKKFYFIGGSDLLLEIKDWKGGNSVKKIIKFLIVPRAGYPIKFKRHDWLYLSKEIELIASSQIRDWLKEKQYKGKHLSKKVFKYIKQRGLYKIIK